MGPRHGLGRRRPSRPSPFGKVPDAAAPTFTRAALQQLMWTDAGAHARRRGSHRAAGILAAWRTAGAALGVEDANCCSSHRTWSTRRCGARHPSVRTSAPTPRSVRSLPRRPAPTLTSPPPSLRSCPPRPAPTRATPLRPRGPAAAASAPSSPSKVLRMLTDPHRPRRYRRPRRRRPVGRLTSETLIPRTPSPRGNRRSGRRSLQRGRGVRRRLQPHDPATSVEQLVADGERFIPR